MTTENLSFQAEVGKILQLVTHSLYKDKQIFLRELISNASDACDKLRYAALTEKTLLETDTELNVTISINKKTHQITIQDNGIGMSKKELTDNLGTIARSGTANFLDKIDTQEADSSKLIGQFGVGFYSVFMVASKVDVYSTKAGSKTSWLWSSTGSEKFSLSPTKLAPIRGTKIIIDLKNESKEYTDTSKLKPIIKKYSDHLNLPIYFDNNDEKEQVNSGMALWARQKKDITQEQYSEFYQNISGQFDEPWQVIHFQAEGQLSYIGLIFIPASPAYDLFMPEIKNKLKLHVRRVYITDEIEELIPNYLRFLHGIIDSEDLPLNVSRETLQFNPMISRINKRIVNQIFKELAKIAENEPEKYILFWNNFGSVIKEGIYTDPDQREKIVKLSRFTSLKKESMSLEEYTSKMPKKQKYIYYLSGQNIAELKNSPHLESLKEKKIDVLLLTDPVDEVWIPIVNNFNEFEFKSVTHGDLELPNKNKTEKSDEKNDIDALIVWLKEKLSTEIKDVRISNRLSESPACIISDDGDLDINIANMLRERGQLNQDLKRVLEINPNHQLILKMQKNIKNKKSKNIDDLAFLLLDQAKLIEGEKVSDLGNFSKRIVQLMHDHIE